MKEILGRLETSVGSYEGEGVNHERQPFKGTLTLKSLLDGRGFTVAIKLYESMGFQVTQTQMARNL